MGIFTGTARRWERAQIEKLHQSLEAARDLLQRAADGTTDNLWMQEVHGWLEANSLASDLQSRKS